MIQVFRQADPKWTRNVFGVSARLGLAGCVISTLGHIVQATYGPPAYTPDDVRELLMGEQHDAISKGSPLVFVDSGGAHPGNLMVWPRALAPYNLVCDEAVASAPDHESKLHEHAGHMVDSNADLAGALAAAMIGGMAAVRVDVDGDGQGDHTIACIGREGDLFVCACSALGAVIKLDENLEGGPETAWDGARYRATGIRAIYRAA